MIAERDSYKTGRLAARPGHPAQVDKVMTGVQPLKLDNKRDGFIYVPKRYDGTKPAPLAVMLHGAGGQAGHGLSILRSYADDHNIILLAPSSRSGTWDIIVDESFGVDVIFIDQALQSVFERYVINRNKILIGGFSDGASYALCLGLSNGDLFTHILAFSPGFAYTAEQRGAPNIFISHGVNDGILPIENCSRRIIKQLEKNKYNVNYNEFKGAHEIPVHMSKSAIDWFLR